jgi:hypothetical protein
VRRDADGLEMPNRLFVLWSAAANKGFMDGREAARIPKQSSSIFHTEKLSW